MVIFHFSCKFERSHCSSEDFKKVLTDYGTCYTFNSYNKSLGRTVKTDKTGINHWIMQYVVPSMETNKTIEFLIKLIMRIASVLYV